MLRRWTCCEGVVSEVGRVPGSLGLEVTVTSMAKKDVRLDVAAAAAGEEGDEVRRRPTSAGRRFW